MQNSLTHFFCEMFGRAAALPSVGRGFCALLLRIRDFGKVWGWLARARRMTATLVLQLALLGVGSASVAADFAASFSGTIGANFNQTASTIDAAGNVYILGSFTDASLTVGTVTITRIGTTDAVVTKIDASGVVIWAKNFGGSGADVVGRSIAVDALGNVHLGGYFLRANLTTPALTKIGIHDAFAFKLDTAGNSVWSKNFGGSGAGAFGESIAIDTSGNVYLGGYFEIANLTTPALTRVGIYDAFAFKLDHAGTSVWARNFGGSAASAVALGIAVDASGSVYLGGYFTGADLTTPALTKIGATDAFAFKLDSTGASVWSRNFGGSAAFSLIRGVAVDGFGNVYLGGFFSGANLTTPALTKIGNHDTFALKLNSAGTSVWGKNFGGNGASAQGRSIAVDAFGNVYLGGFFSGADLTTPAVVKLGSRDAFAFKLDSAGNRLWSKNFGGIGADALGLNIAADGSGNVYFGGNFQTADLTSPALSKTGNQNSFVLKLDSVSNITLAKGVSYLAPGGDIFVTTTAVDATGNTYLSGYFNSVTVKLGGITLPRLGNIDVIVAKLNAAGTVLWAKNFGGIGTQAYGESIAVDASGNVYLGGRFSFANLTTPALIKIGYEDAFALKLDSAGNTVWARNFGGSGAGAQGRSIAVDASGNVYLGGSLQNANLTVPALTSFSTSDAFAFKLDSFGTSVWSRNFGGSGTHAFGTSVAVDASGNVYLGGGFSGANPTIPALTKIGMVDVFAFKLDSTGASVWARNFGGSGARVNGESIAVDASGNVYLAGYFAEASLTTPALSKIGSQDAFAFKLDSVGASVWSRNFGGSGAHTFGRSIAVDASNNVFLGGYFYTANLTAPALTKMGIMDAFAFKLGSAGTTVWAKNFGGSGADAEGLSIAVDVSSNVYLGGNFRFANLTTPALTKIGSRDAFIIKRRAGIAVAPIIFYLLDD